MSEPGADFSDLDKKMKASQKKVENFGKKMQGIGSGLTKGVTAPVAAFAGATVKLAADFEDSLAKVGTIADTSKMSLQAIGDEARKVSSATGTSANEINEALYQAISAGAKTEDAMKLVEVATKAAKGGFTDTTTAIDGLTSVMNIYGIETKDAGELANKFLVTQNKGKTTFGELAGSIGKIAPIASTMGISIDEVLAGLASLTASGIATSEAVSGMKAAFSNIIKPSKAASETAERLGIDFSSAALESKGLAGFLADVQAKAKGNTDDLAALFGSVEAFNAMAVLTSEDGLVKMNEAFGEMQTNTTAVDDAFNKVTDTSSEQLNLLINDLKNTGIELGQNLMPIIRELLENYIKPFVKRVGELAKKFSEMSPEAKENTLKLIGLAAAAGPVLKLVGGITRDLGPLIKMFGGLTKVVSGAGGVTSAIGGASGLGPVLLGLFNPTTGAILAVIAGIALLVYAFDDIKAAAKSAKEEGTLAYQALAAGGKVPTAPKPVNSSVNTDDLFNEKKTTRGTSAYNTQVDLAQTKAKIDFKSKQMAAYATGTNYVPMDGLAYLHKGEAVIPADRANAGYVGGITINISGNTIMGDRDADRLGETLVRRLKLAGVKV